MALDPSDRYQTPEALAADIEQWLSGEPVSAWREPFLDRCRRWLARRRTLVLGLRFASALTLILATVVVGSVLWSNRKLSAKNVELRTANQRVEEARSQAERRLDLAEMAIGEFHQAVTENLDVKNMAELKPLRNALLEAPLRFYRQLRLELEEATVSQPEARVRLARAIGGLAKITTQIESEANAIKAFEEAIGIVSPIARDQLALPESQLVLSDTLASLALVQFDIKQQPSALSNVMKARDLCESLYQTDSANEQFKFMLAELENRLGVMLRNSDRANEAKQSHEKARSILLELVQAHPEDDRFQSLLAVVLSNMGVLLYQSEHRPREASEYYEQARDIQRKLVRDHPGVVTHLRGLANTCFNLGNMRIATSTPKEAFAGFHEARTVQQELVREQPTVSDYQAGLAKTEGSIGTLLNYQGRAPEARPHLEEAHRLYSHLVSDHPDVYKHRVDLARTQYHLAHAQKNTGQVALALAGFERARDLYEKLLSESPNVAGHHEMLALSWHYLAEVLTATGRGEECLAAYKQAVAHQRVAYKSDPDDVRGALVDHYQELLRQQLRRGLKAEMKCSVDEALQLFDGTGAQNTTLHYYLACFCSMKSSLDDTCADSKPSSGQTHGPSFADRAIGILRQLVEKRAYDPTRLATDPLLDPLRSRADFRLLLWDVNFPIKPFAS
jgi:tetratricopeptide (TPR) repeat protein